MGRYVLDFYATEANLAIELDGGVHDERAAIDAVRTSELEAMGLRLLRFRNEELDRNLESVLSMILEACQ